MRRWAAVLLGLWGTAAFAAPSATLDEYVRLQVGSFTSEAQARQDLRYDAVTWHIAEIWPGGREDERWLYIESWMPEAPAPYMQRISRLRAEPDGTIAARRASVWMPAIPTWTGVWPSSLPSRRTFRGSPNERMSRSA